MKNHICKTDSRFIVDFDESIAQFHNFTIQFHCDFLYGGNHIGLLSLELNVETVVVCLTLGCKDVAASGWKPEQIPIKCLKVVVSPCAAELVVVRWAHYYFERK